MIIKVYRSASRDETHLIPQLGITYDPNAVIYIPPMGRGKEVSVSVYFLRAFVELCLAWGVRAEKREGI